MTIELNQEIFRKFREIINICDRALLNSEPQIEYGHKDVVITYERYGKKAIVTVTPETKSIRYISATSIYVTPIL